MDDRACIRLWMREDVPARFRHLAPLDDRGGVIVVFVAHVPTTVLVGRTYRQCNRDPRADGWIREGELGLFGTNALDTVPHPDGDGILLVGSCV